MNETTTLGLILAGLGLVFAIGSKIWELIEAFLRRRADGKIGGINGEIEKKEKELNEASKEANAAVADYERERARVIKEDKGDV